MRYRILLLCLLGMTLGMTVASGLHAQRPTKDKEKARQWKSMENGPWDFAPDWYYFLLHKKYSGAEMYWKWAGFQSGFRVRFKEHKSNVKRIMPTRVTAEETQRQKIKKVEEERQKMEELYQEELLREADRNVDLMFPSYKDEFNRMQDCITDGDVPFLQGRVQPDAGLHHRRTALLHAEKQGQAPVPGGRTEPPE